MDNLSLEQVFYLVSIIFIVVLTIVLIVLVIKLVKILGSVSELVDEAKTMKTKLDVYSHLPSIATKKFFEVFGGKK